MRLSAGFRNFAKPKSESRNYYESYEISRCRNQNLEITTKSEFLGEQTTQIPKLSAQQTVTTKHFRNFYGLSNVLAIIEGSERYFPENGRWVPLNDFSRLTDSTTILVNQFKQPKTLLRPNDRRQSSTYDRTLLKITNMTFIAQSK